VETTTTNTLSDSIPLRLGTPLRAPLFAWPDWGIDMSGAKHLQLLLEQSEEAYRCEWEHTDHRNHDRIQNASQLAGLGQANGLLNAYLGKVAGILMAQIRRDTIRVLDVGAGAGATTLSVWRNLSATDRCRVQWTLIDPAIHALQQAESLLRQEGMASDQLILHAKRDAETVSMYCSHFDLVISSAAIHHHADVRPVFEDISRALMPGGFLVVADWHNTLSAHPAFILSLLDQLDWCNKRQDMQRFKRAYPRATEIPPLLTARQRRANRQIMAFWVHYAQLNEQASDKFYVLEGHRPVAHYLRELIDAGLDVPSLIPQTQDPNPVLLLPDSELLAVSVAHKPIVKIRETYDS